MTFADNEAMESDTSQPLPKSHRPWYRLYWLTWVLVCCVTGSVVVENLVGQKVMVEHWKDGSIWTWDLSHGWPFRFGLRGGIDTGFRKDLWTRRWLIDIGEVDGFRLLPFIMDTLIAIAIILATIFASESYIRRIDKWYQFSISLVMVFTAFVAFLLANYKYDTIRWQGDSLWEYVAFFLIAIGSWCVLWTG